MIDDNNLKYNNLIISILLFLQLVMFIINLNLTLKKRKLMKK